MNLLEQMKTGEFSDLEQNILRFILEHLDEVPEMTLRQLAAKTYSSNASILRLCRKLGLDGYRSLILELAKESRTVPNTPVDWMMPFSHQDSIKQIIASMNSISQAASQSVSESLDPDVLRKAALVILNSRQIFTAAVGDSAARTDTFRHMMLKLGKFLIPVEMSGDTGAYAANSGSEDCLLAVSYGARHEELNRTAEEFQKKGAFVISITANNLGRLASASNLLISFPRHTQGPVPIGPFYAQMAIGCILNTLYAVIYSLRWQENSKRKEASEASNRVILEH